MPRWVFHCAGCNKLLSHCEITDTGKLNDLFLVTPKPDIPASGVSVECPECKKIAVYKRYQLIYQTT